MENKTNTLKVARFLQHEKTGFSLPELLIVVIILLILSAISIPIYINMKASTSNQAAIADLTMAAKSVAIAHVSGENLVVESDKIIINGHTAMGTNNGTLTYHPVPGTEDWCLQLTTESGNAYRYTNVNGASTGTCVGSPSAPPTTPPGSSTGDPTTPPGSGTGDPTTPPVNNDPSGTPTVIPTPSATPTDLPPATPISLTGTMVRATTQTFNLLPEGGILDLSTVTVNGGTILALTENGVLLYQAPNNAANRTVTYTYTRGGVTQTGNTLVINVVAK